MTIIPAPFLHARQAAARGVFTRSSVLATATMLALALLGGCTQQAAPTAPENGPAQVITVDLQAATPAGLPRCDDTLAGVTAYVVSPASLWTCQVGTWIALPCTKALAGAVAYASATQTLLACAGGAWAPVPLPPGPKGATGPQGATGMTGARGAPGTLLALSTEPPGANCSTGGQRVDVGADLNGNGTLDSNEVTRTAYVCNGATGAPGPKGDPGDRGPSGLTTLAAATTEPPGANCAQGGVKVSTGVDVNGNGALDGAEGANVTYVCNGATGTAGASSLVSSNPEPPGANCANGGVRLDSGVDADGNGALSAGEVSHTSYVCNGGSSTRVAQFDDPTCDPSVAPDAEHAVFADAIGGDDVLGTGDAGAPVQSVGKAIALAAGRGKSSVYLAAGIYGGAATLPAGSAIYVEGGWQHGALGSWTRNCDAAAREGTVLAGVVVNGVGGLRALTVRTENGQSNLAVRVAAGTLKIRDCALLAGDAANGVVGKDGAPGATGSSTFACSGAAGSTGSAGVPVPPPANSGGSNFAPSGAFSPGNGGTAVVTTSQDGQNGPASAPVTCAAGQCTYNYTLEQNASACGSRTDYFSCNPHNCNCDLFGCDTCYDSCPITTVFSCDVATSCTFTQTSTTTATGSCGQGGKGGRPGLGGTGGGASVALVIAAGASVDVVGSAFTAKNGGSGARGGAGGPAGLGGTGNSQSCDESICESALPCNWDTTTKVSRAGGKGGDGAPGPAGGAGAGGPSFGIVKLGTAALTIDDASTIAFGIGGTGAAGAPDGGAQAVVTF